jgi:DNA-binding transcriptional regulator YiaG
MASMNIAAALKNEIVRLARKELRAESKTLKKVVATHRSDLAALKRRVQALEQQLRRHSKPKQPAAIEAKGSTPEGKVRFSAKGLAAQRKRLGLSAQDLGLLLGASGQSIYNWESGEIRPRASQLVQIATVRTMGKKEAAARLEALRTAPAKS